MKSKTLDLVGRKFGRLTVLEKYHVVTRFPKWRCLCDCGQTVIVSTGNLLNGITKSCGCLRRDRARERLKAAFADSHHESRTALYRYWCNKRLLMRRANPPAYFCDKWEVNFEAFKKWALEHGYKEGMILIRKDPAAGYSPENLLWVSREEGKRHRKSANLILGKTLAEWARELGVKPDTIVARIKLLGWSEEKAVTTPSRKARAMRQKNKRSAPV